ncbi:MAG: nucleotide exchange factor GrpE [Gemmatimonadaceae bacterium]|nr:nucleotide exchange factor GrpE [Gemmatimonadaceae bacterium]
MKKRQEMSDSASTDQIDDDRPEGVEPALDAVAALDDDMVQNADPEIDSGRVPTGAEIRDDAAERLSQLQRDLTTERDKHLRLVAEFDNFRKRMMKHAGEAESRGQADLVKSILDPLDDIARFAHVDPAATESTTLVEGVDMVEKKMTKALRAAGLEFVNPIGERFDPSLHEAVATEVTKDPQEDGTVARVYQVGHTFKGQLLRPARVVVRQHHDAR